jgi:hypothetical protein
MVAVFTIGLIGFLLDRLMLACIGWWTSEPGADMAFIDVRRLQVVRRARASPLVLRNVSLSVDAASSSRCSVPWAAASRHCSASSPA